MQQSFSCFRFFNGKYITQTSFVFIGQQSSYVTQDCIINALPTLYYSRVRRILKTVVKKKSMCVRITEHTSECVHM